MHMQQQPEQNRAECAEYVCQLSLQLARIARAKDLIGVAALLEMAAIEAETASEDLQPRKKQRGGDNDRRSQASADRPNHAHGA